MFISKMSLKVSAIYDISQRKIWSVTASHGASCAKYVINDGSPFGALNTAV